MNYKHRVELTHNWLSCSLCFIEYEDVKFLNCSILWDNNVTYCPKCFSLEEIKKYPYTRALALKDVNLWTIQWYGDQMERLSPAARRLARSLPEAVGLRSWSLTR